jgi:hypothetical protein
METSSGGSIHQLEAVHHTLCKEELAGLLVDGYWIAAKHQQLKGQRIRDALLPQEIAVALLPSTRIAGLQQNTKLQIDGVMMFRPTEPGAGARWASSSDVLDMRFPNAGEVALLPGLIIPSPVLKNRMDLVREKASESLTAVPQEILSSMRLLYARMMHVVHHNRYSIHISSPQVRNPFGIQDLDALEIEPVSAAERETFAARLKGKAVYPAPENMDSLFALPS